MTMRQDVTQSEIWMWQNPKVSGWKSFKLPRISQIEKPIFPDRNYKVKIIFQARVSFLPGTE